MTKIVDADLPEVARIYNVAFEIGQGHRATQIVAQRFGVQRSTAWRHLKLARDAGLVRIFEEGHRPGRARFSSGPTWPACVECHQPWPCDSSNEEPA